MLLLWKEGSSYWQVGLGYAFIGIGVGFAGTPASHSLTGSVPVASVPAWRPGPPISSATSAAPSCSRSSGRSWRPATRPSFAAAIAASPDAQKVSDSVEAQLTKSFAGAEAVAQQYPKYADQITAAAKASFLSRRPWAYLAGIVAVLLGAALVFFMFPRKDDEQRLLAEYHQIDTRRTKTA